MAQEAASGTRERPCRAFGSRRSMRSSAAAAKIIASAFSMRILIKENHIRSAGGITAALQRAYALDTEVPVEVEVETHDELLEALDAGADRILLDNFIVSELKTAVDTVRQVRLRRR